MTLIQEVTRLVGELGEASADDLGPYMRHASRKQILSALNNAAHQGKIECLRQLPRTDKGAGLGVYVVAGTPPAHRSWAGTLPVNSIFQLGDRAAGASA
jgi:acyl-CoA reductase-like NAD-dependent aldehyde dehydrogenase